VNPYTAIWSVLVYIVLPLWVLAGFADYLCHRASNIEHVNGAKESALHWLMLGEVGVPLVAALFLKIDALLIAFMILCLIAHELTGYADLRLAMRTRRVTVFEKQVHSILEIMPFTALLLLCLLHWRQAQALFGFGPDSADFSISLKEPPAWSALLPPAAGFLIFAILPYLEELWRGLRAEAQDEVTGPSAAGRDAP
jgi:hypothetical protein